MSPAALLLAATPAPLLAAAPPAPFAYRAHLAAAQGALARQDLRAARAWLGRIPRSRRGWEWGVLQRLTEQSLQVFRAHPEGGSALATGGDGRWIVSAGQDGTIAVRDGQGRLLSAWKAHESAVTGAQVAGDLLATSGRDKRVKTWRLPEGSPVADFAGHSQAAYGVAVSADGGRIASPGWRRGDKGEPIGVFLVWDSARPDAPRRVDWTSHPLAAAAWSPDGRQLVVGGWDHRSRAWDGATLAGSHEFTTEPNSAYRAVDAVAVSPDGSLLATACRDRKARLHRTKDGALAAILDGHLDAVTAVAFDSTGQRLATASRDGALRIFTGPEWRLTEVLRGHDAPVRGLAWLGQDEVVTLDQDGWLRRWDTASAAGPVLRHGGFAWAFALSPDGRKAALSGSPGVVRIFDAQDGRELRALEAHPGRVALLAWSPDGQALLSGASPGPPKVWNVADGTLRHTLEGPSAGIPDGACGPGLFVASAYDHTVRAWDLASGRPLGIFGGARNPMGAVVLPQGRVASGGGDGIVRIWDPRTGLERQALASVGSAIQGMALDPTGRKLAVGGAAGTVRVFDLPKDRHLDLAGHTAGVNGLAWSPDGTRLATGSQDLSLRVWDAASGEELVAFHDFATGVYRLAWSPDGTRLWYLLEGGEARCLEGSLNSPRPAAAGRSPDLP